MENNVKNSENANSADGKANLALLEENNATIFTLFKICGIFLIKWNPAKGVYIVRKFRFFFFYMFWFLWPLIGLGIAVYGQNSFNLEDKSNTVSTDINTSVSILCFAVFPAVMTYSLNLITRFLPEGLVNIVSLRELEVGFKSPITIHPFRRILKLVSLKKDVHEYIRQEKVIFILPFITVIISVVAFIATWILGIFGIVNWNALWSEWPLFIMLMTYLTFPVITNLFCTVFLEWFLTAYEALESGINDQCQLLKRHLGKDETTFGSLNHAADLPGYEAIERSGTPASRVTLDNKRILHLHDYVDRLQTIFHCISEGFLKYIMGTNYLVYLVVSVYSTVKLFAGYDQIFFMIPLSISITHLALSCYKSNCLMDAHERTVVALKRILQLGRNRSDLLPWSELNNVRETLLVEAPQVAIFGGYRVGNGLFITALGFIITYAVLASDLMSLNILYNSSYNATLAGYYDY